MTAVEAIAVRAHEAIVVVDGVRVRWVIHGRMKSPPPRWKCDEHGTSDVPICEHAAHAAARIAHELLGLPAEVTTSTTEKKEQ